MVRQKRGRRFERAVQIFLIVKKVHGLASGLSAGSLGQWRFFEFHVLKNKNTIMAFMMSFLFFVWL